MGNTASSRMLNRMVKAVRRMPSRAKRRTWPMERANWLQTECTFAART